MSKADATTTESTDAEKVEQVKTANEMTKAKWEGDFKEEDLTIPYKKEEEDVKDETSNAESTGDSEDEADTEEETQETYTEPAPVITVQDPGEYKEPDVGFEVEIKVGDKIKTVKIKSPEDAEKIADDPDNFETPKQLMDFLNKQNKMNNALDKSKADWESQKAIFDEQNKTAQERQQIIDNMGAEFDYLVTKKLLPTIAKEYKDADWSDPQVAKQPGVKEQIELLNYMTKENETRQKARIAPLTSIVDAYNAWMLDKNRVDAKEAGKQAGEARKAAGARIAGVSGGGQAPATPPGIAVGNPNVFKRDQTVWDN